MQLLFYRKLLLVKVETSLTNLCDSRTSTPEGNELSNKVTMRNISEQANCKQKLLLYLKQLVTGWSLCVPLNRIRVPTQELEGSKQI